jgi:hypothetical protein
MAGKANFIPEEWARVVAGPMIAGRAITAADPGRSLGAVAGSVRRRSVPARCEAERFRKSARKGGGGGHRHTRNQDGGPRPPTGAVQRRAAQSTQGQGRRGTARGCGARRCQGLS